MKQSLDLLLSALKKLEKTGKTDDITKLEEDIALIIKDLTSSIAENKYSKDDDLKSRIGELGEVIKNLNKNHEKQSKVFEEFMKYKSRYIARDKFDRIVFFADSLFTLQMSIEKFDKLRFHEKSEF